MRFKQFISEMNDVSGLIKTSSAEQLEAHLQKNYKTMHPHPYLGNTTSNTEKTTK